MEGSVEDFGAPESWEVADLEESVSRLTLSSNKDKNKDSKAHEQLLEDGPASALSAPSHAPSAPASGNSPEDAIDQVDQFLREALQNPRERLSILRMEQDMEKFIRDPTQQQFEFQQLPTSYLRLAAHRVAQHYSLQSMVLLDSNSLDGSGSRIIVRKTSECRLPAIRLADIPVNLPSEEKSAVKVFIKQRPQKQSLHAGGGNSKSLKSSGAKSVEERKEEYNRARARIFNSNNPSGGAGGRPETEPRMQDGSQDGSFGLSKMEEKPISGVTDANSRRGIIDSAPGSSRSGRGRVEKEPISRSRANSRIAIFRDREVERNDPDYDRSYDRYTRRFDPGFGFNGGPYAIQPSFTPSMNYNTEFPQLRSPHRPQLSAEHQPLPLHQHLSGLWAAPSGTAGIGYGHPETLMTPYSPAPAGAHSASGVHLQSSQYSGQRPGMAYSYPHDNVHSIFSQQPDTSSELARPW
ncbi:R3H domain-containing protein 2-like [Punica granatum]|uniref:R3H domain-containing protein 2-like n=2 Tax=Punica granatum TaxID=22663 RepID=A0A6P8BPV7_PUNGR|nr:R3H domain-containing protein 2-like [Punica granatum]XP_031372364.1 R3H domain-containing protein 2-like [Punica granatum]PKI44308.1 hypothetical protein CRG98_035290 [Punica granatum]